MVDNQKGVNGAVPGGPRLIDAWDFDRIPSPTGDAGEAKPCKVSLPPIEDAATLIAEPGEQPVELVKGVLHAGGKMVIGGGSKSFKTWLLSDLALALKEA